MLGSGVRDTTGGSLCNYGINYVRTTSYRYRHIQE